MSNYLHKPSHLYPPTLRAHLYDAIKFGHTVLGPYTNDKKTPLRRRGTARSYANALHREGNPMSSHVRALSFSIREETLTHVADGIDTSVITSYTLHIFLPGWDPEDPTPPEHRYPLYTGPSPFELEESRDLSQVEKVIETRRDEYKRNQEEDLADRTLREMGYSPQHPNTQTDKTS